MRLAKTLTQPKEDPAQVAFHNARKGSRYPILSGPVLLILAILTLGGAEALVRLYL